MPQEGAQEIPVNSFHQQHIKKETLQKAKRSLAIDRAVQQRSPYAWAQRLMILTRISCVCVVARDVVSAFRSGSSELICNLRVRTRSAIFSGNFFH